ncbi:hypothetical protein [Leuconostoc citreum]|uniref:hypothetical protein n=1 Tax=Leuconostoc citreum TaxID=33964 RepID=UPI0015DB8C64|nr:hypothetical protein [Leuconostoc citreum]
MAKRKNKNIPPVTPAGSTNIPEQSIPNNNFVFRTHYNWLTTVKYEDFTNNYQDEKVFSETIIKIIHKTIPILYENYEDIFINRKARQTPLSHSHLLTNNALELAKKIAKLITNTDIDNDLYSWWQIGGKQGTRIIGVYLADSKVFYPIFIDCYHLLFPDKHYNQTDYNKFKYSI